MTVVNETGHGDIGGHEPRSPVAMAVDDTRVRSVFTAVGLALVGYSVLQILWPAPMGIYVQGAVVGGLTALISFGIALIYRANRIANFAQGDLGAVSAILAVLLIVGPRWPYPLAVLTGLAVAVVLGAVVELAIIRRFFKAPRLLLTVATLILSPLLATIGTIQPAFFDLTVPPQNFPSPFNFSFEIKPVTFRGNDVIAMVAIPLVILALAAMFRYTNVGIAIRGSAESAERAFLLGVPVKRIQTVVWIIASVLSFSAIFLRAGIVGLPIGRVLGPQILIRALAAAVIGRMENLPVIFAAAVGLGIVEQSIFWSTGKSILVAPVLFVIVLVALLLQRQRGTGRAEEGSSWRAAQEVRPIPRELARLPEIRIGLGVLKAIGLAILLGLPFVLPESRINLAGAVLIYAIIGISLVVLTGWSGQVSLGQVAFFGIGAAVAGAVTTRLQWDPFIAIMLGGVAGAVAALVVGLPALRLRGLFLAVTTLAFAQATSNYVLNRQFMDWWLPQGRIPRNPMFGIIAVDTEIRFYYLTVIGFLLAAYAAKGLRNSHAGRAIIGTRENERAVQSYGISGTTSKLAAFALSGFLAAFAGGIFVHHQQALGIESFALEESLAVFTMAVIGGLGSIPGALLGALWFRGGAWFLPTQVRFLATGIGGLLVLWLLPGGLGSVLYRGRDAILRLVANRRRLMVPSLFADARETDTAFSKIERGVELGSLSGMRATALAGADDTVLTTDEMALTTEPDVDDEAFAPEPKGRIRRARAANGAKKAAPRKAAATKGRRSR